MFTDKKKAIIVDMDGTLVDVSGIRHYVRESLLPDGTYSKKNFDDFHKASILCPAHHSVIDSVENYWTRRYDVIVVTARSERYRKTTTDWLYKYAVPYTTLYMRPEGDYRADVEVKRDIYNDLIYPKWRVDYAIDDNPNVINLWRSLGIYVMVVPGWED